MVVAERPEVLGCQEPRICVIPDGDEHPRWKEIVEWLESLGISLDPWQSKILWASLLRRGKQWAAFTVAVCAPRQNGKNGILEPRQLVGARVIGERLQIHSAHLADTSKEGFRRLEDVIDANDWFPDPVSHIWRTNGHESIEFTDGCRIRFRTRTRGGGRGFSGSPIYFDEAMYLPEVSMGAILPVISAQPDPQVWYMGSAVDQLVHEDGTAFSRVRERALAGEDQRLAYFEWSVDADKPDDLEADVLEDPESWAQANPALGIRISADYIASEYRELDPRTFAVERLGVGDWPDPHASSTVIDLGLWDSLTDVNSHIPGVPVFAFDVSPTRGSATISAAGGRADVVHVETVQHQREGVGWLVPSLIEKAKKHRAAKLVCDGASPAAALIPELEKHGIQVEALTAQDYARACGVFFDFTDQKKLRHLGTTELRSAIKGAATRPLGDAWAWSRKNSGVDITPLVAATLAVWGAAAPETAAWGGSW